jgi:glucose-1-phosphate thymidylyltransferase
VYDKTMIYFPLTTLMLAGIRQILIITHPREASQFRSLLGDGTAWGLELSYAVQPSPDGLPQAFLIGRDFIAGGRSALALGDNTFYGESLISLLRGAVARETGAVIFAYRVRDPSQFGVIDFAPGGGVRAIIEKPKNPPSHFAVTGLYFYDEQAADVAASLKPSARGELEITDLNNHCLRQGNLSVETLGRGYAWLDTGTPESLLQASEFMAAVEARQGLKIGCPEEIAWRQGWIDDTQLEKPAVEFKGGVYGQYLTNLLMHQ